MREVVVKSGGFRWEWGAFLWYRLPMLVMEVGFLRTCQGSFVYNNRF